MKDLSRKVSLICSVCGNDHFSIADGEYEDLSDAPESALFKCSDCGRVVTKQELIEENEEKINANLEDINKEALAEMEKELKKAFKKIRR